MSEKMEAFERLAKAGVAGGRELSRMEKINFITAYCMVDAYVQYELYKNDGDQNRADTALMHLNAATVGRYCDGVAALLKKYTRRALKKVYFGEPKKVITKAYADEIAKKIIDLTL